MTKYVGAEVYLHAFSTFVLDRRKWPTSRSTRFTTGEIAPANHWIRASSGPRAGLGCRDAKDMYAPGGNEPRLLNEPARSLVNMALSYVGNSKELRAWMLHE